MATPRLLAFALVAVACSSSKQPDPAPAPVATDPAPAKSAEPAPGEAAADPLRADFDIICGAAKATGGRTVMAIGPYIAETMKTDFKVELFADIRNTTLDEFIARIRKGMARIGLTQCDTVDVLIANDPRKQP